MTTPLAGAAVASQPPWWPAIGGIALYLLLVLGNPARASLRNGCRAVRRYRWLWIPPAIFGMSYAFFQLGLDACLAVALPPADRPAFVWLRAGWRDPQLWLTGSPESLWHLPAGALASTGRNAILPALETVAGLFNCLVSTFPLAPVAALLLLINWRGHLGVLWRALLHRYERCGAFVFAAILLCATAALMKPMLYAVARHVDPLVWFQWSPVAAWLAGLFEYLFGVCVQIYLILVASCWVRGATFTHAHLLDFAIRRLSFVFKWAALVMLLTSTFIELPLILKNFAPFARIFTDDGPKVEARLLIARSFITAFLLLFSTVQITLVFHSESLRDAIRDHVAFLRRHWWPYAGFLIVATLHLYALQLANLTIRLGLGERTAPGIAWQLLFPFVAAFLSAWLLASWVCLYQQCESGRTPDSDWIPF